MVRRTGNETKIFKGRITDAMTFNEKVWALTCQVPKGKVTSYAEIAHALGTQAYRAVGNALNKNPFGMAVPCHRVVGSGNKIGGFGSNLAKKRKLLAAEGVKVKGDRVDAKAMYELQLSLRKI